MYIITGLHTIRVISYYNVVHNETSGPKQKHDAKNAQNRV